jgi:hydroxyacylglutathione hydrolase
MVLGEAGSELLHIPLGALPDRIAEVPRERPLVVYCRTGARSMIAAGLLQAHGFRDVVNLAGGFKAWRAAGFPSQRDTGRAQAA